MGKFFSLFKKSYNILGHNLILVLKYHIKVLGKAIKAIWHLESDLKKYYTRAVKNNST